jgi:hypothetical protein
VATPLGTMPIDTALYQLPLTPDQIYSACKHVTPHLAKELIRGQAVIPRKNVQTLLDRFLTSPLRGYPEISYHLG